MTIAFATSDEQAFGFADIQHKRIARQDRYKKRRQRPLARRVKGFSNYNKTKRRVARHRRYAVDLRRDVAHKTSHALARDDRYNLYVLEAL